MSETSFSKKFASSTPVNEDGKRWRKGFVADNASGLHPFCLSLWSKDGRHMGGPSMGLFKHHDWIDEGGPVQKLVMEFSHATVYVEALHCKHCVESMLEEGKLKRIQEHDSNEIEAIRAHNLDVRKPEEKEPAVIRIIVAPDLKARLRSDESLAPILRALEGEQSDEPPEFGGNERQ